MYTCMHVCMHVCVRVCACVRAFVCVYSHMHAYREGAELFNGFLVHARLVVRVHTLEGRAGGIL